MNKINESGKVTFGQAVRDFWAGYFDFKGTSTRAGFWWGALIYAICNFIVGFLRGFTRGFMASKGMTPNVTVITVIYYILLIAITVPILAAAARHFRDEGLKEGVIIALVIAYIALQVLLKLQPAILWLVFIFNVVMIVLLCMPTGKFNDNSNREG